MKYNEYDQQLSASLSDLEVLEKRFRTSSCILVPALQLWVPFFSVTF
jgi:hypothetical protein